MLREQRLQIFPFLFVLYEISLYLSNDMYLPSMPAIAADLGLTQAQIQNTLTLWFLGASSLQFIIGPISDRFGRKIIISVGGALFIASTIVCAMTNDISHMYIARFVQGSTICFVVVAGNAAIHESFSVKEAIKWLALCNAITILAPALGPLCGAIVVEFASWRYIFWFLALMGILSFLSVLIIMPETNDNPHPLHLRVILVDFIKILSNKDFMVPCIGYCLLVGMFFFWMFESPFIYQSLGQSTLFYGIAQTCIFSLFFVGAKITKWWLQNHDLPLLVRGGSLITLVGTLLLLITSIFFNNIYWGTFCMMVIALGSSMLFAPMNRIAIDAANQPMGRRIAVFTTSISVAGAISGWLISVIDAGNLYAVSLLITICGLVALGLILLTEIPKSYNT